MDSLSASGLTPQLYDWTLSSEHLGFAFSFFITLFDFFGSMRQIKLAINQLLGTCKYSV